jgi:uncharacterized protein GlcG (DUF336 family)
MAYSSGGNNDMKIPSKTASLVALKIVVGFAVALLLCVPAGAQASANTPDSRKDPANAPGSAHGLVMQRNLSLPMAKTIAEAALAECAAKGYHTAVAVVDRAGQIMVILRDEQATAQVAEMARRKAYTARMFRSTTLDFQKRTTPDAPNAAQRDVADILALGGGAPILVGNDAVGGVGSAGSTQEQDDACAKAGVAKVADLLK